MYEHVDWDRLTFGLARAMLAAPWSAPGVAEEAAAFLGQWPAWLDPLVLHVTSAYRRSPGDLRALERVISVYLREHRVEPPPPAAAAVPAVRRPRGDHSRPPRSEWRTAAIDSVPDLADALELSLGQLAWLADVRSLERTVADERLRNYRYAAVPRRSGLPRVIEAPKLRLKEIQRWILREILDHVPAHEAAQGFTRGRSVIDHAAVHTGRHAVLRLDLADFFASVSAGRVFGIFQTLGYRAAVAHALTGLTTNVVPQHVWEVVRRTAAASAPVPATFRLGRALATPHLPQGGPTSPALANLAAFRLDRRLAGLATAAGVRYSRYADDLTFSGGRLRRSWTNLEALVGEIARDEGFVLNAGKSTLRTAATRQQVCGIVVNATPNVPRDEYDRLKAVLHNAVRDGPAAQGLAGRRAHLEGRIAWVASLNPARGEKLKRRFAEIDWTR